MKKLLGIGLCAVLLLTSFVSCSGILDDDSAKKTAETHDIVDNQKITGFQSKIDSAASGGTVELEEGVVPANSKITIAKPLTVDGKNVDGLTVEISADVSNNVTLKNFKNASIRVLTDSNTQSRYAGNNRSADSSASADHFEKIGENSPKLKLEGCTVSELESESKLALYVDNGDKKSTIEEIKLKDGAEDFTFIEMDKADMPETTVNEATETSKKTKVGKLSIESDEVGKINLIGGTFDDVALADDFAGKIDFKYDKEFADQLNFTSKDTFLGDSKIEEKDIAIVDSLASGSGIYKFSIPVEYYMLFDGYYTVVFMTDAQASALAAAAPPFSIPKSVANMENPMYAAIPTGTFKIDFEGDKSKPLTIFGGEGGYIDYGAAYSRGLLDYYEKQDIVVLENYRNYNKEAFIATVDSSNVNIYVNMAEIRKSDIVICAQSDEGGYGEAGSKVAEINLSDYKPYISLYWGQYRQHYEEIHPQPAFPLSDFSIFENYRTADGDIDYTSFAADYPDEYSLLQTYGTQTEAYEPAYEQSRSFALANAIKSKNEENAEYALDLFVPYGNALKLSWQFSGTFTPMETSSTYPDVSDVVPTVKPVEGRNIYQEMIDTWWDESMEEEEYLDEPDTDQDTFDDLMD